MTATLVVENGTGVYNANAYASLGEVALYLRKRGRATAWDAATLAGRTAAILAATDYIEKIFGGRFKGRKEFREVAVPASSVLDIATLPVATDSVTIGATTYTFVDALTSAYDVLIGVDVAATITNLADAINAEADAIGVTVGAATAAHPDVSAVPFSAEVYIEAKVAGVDGNEIATTASPDGENLLWTSDTLLDGSDGVEQPLEFPRSLLYLRSGQLASGIPTKLKHATAEYAERALAGTLLPDPEVSDTGKTVVSSSSKVGPIEEAFTYSDGGSIEFTIRPYPAADNLLKEFVVPLGRVYRG